MQARIYVLVFVIVTLLGPLIVAQDRPLLTNGGLPQLNVSQEMRLSTSDFTVGIPEKYKFLYSRSEQLDIEQIRASMPYSEIRLARSTCLVGNCPTFEVTLNVEGSATYNGIAFAKHKGEKRSKVPLAEFGELCWALERLGIQNEKRHGDVTPHDAQTTAIRLTTRDGTRIQISDFGCPFTIEFTLVASHIEHIADRLDWHANSSEIDNNGMHAKPPNARVPSGESAPAAR